MNITDEGTAAEWFDDLCRGVGLAVLKFVPVCDRLGWASAQAAETYVHGSDLPAAIFKDFIAVAVHGTDVEAADRLREVATACQIDADSLGQRLHAQTG